MELRFGMKSVQKKPSFLAEGFGGNINEHLFYWSKLGF